MTKQELQVQETEFKPRVHHLRRCKEMRGIHAKSVIKRAGMTIAPKGGKTIVELLRPDGVVAAFGVADCSERDGYNRRVGRSIALGRALASLDRI